MHFVCMHLLSEHHTRASSCMSSNSMLTFLSSRADHRYSKVGMCPGFQNRVGLTRWHVPWAFMGSNPDNRAQSEVNERFMA
jgi:hypothetical protein